MSINHLTNNNNIYTDIAFLRINMLRIYLASEDTQYSEHT